MRKLLEYEGNPTSGQVVTWDGSKFVPSTAGSGGVTDHGALTGLADDDHTQYHNDARGDARYSALSHTHAASAITDFSEAVDDKVAALLVAGTNITLTYNDGANSLTIDAASGGGGDEVLTWLSI